MDFSGNTSTSVAGPPVTTPPAPSIEQDARPTADVARATTDATPEIPLPLPATASQTGLVSAATLSSADSKTKMESTGVSTSERTLKPYGITMLPEKIDSSDQKR